MNSYRSREAWPRSWFARGCDPRPKHAFTILEVLVTLAILGLLAGLTMIHVTRTSDTAAQAAARLYVRQAMKTVLESYRFTMGEYPSTAEGVSALITAPPGKSARWAGPYLGDKTLPLDPWNEPYQYAYPGKHNPDGYDVWSKGKDKLSGTPDDIGNWSADAPGSSP